VSEFLDDAAHLGAMLDSFVGATIGAMGALVMSSDGLLAAMSSSLKRSDADQLSAAALGIIGLARSGVRRLGGVAVNQVIVELERGYMHFMPMDAGNALIVVSTIPSDVGVTGYEMSMLADRICAFVTNDRILGLRSFLAAN
jgi:uncharacterized protein